MSYIMSRNCKLLDGGVVWVSIGGLYSAQGVSHCLGVFHQCSQQVFAFCGLVEMLTTFVAGLHELFRL